MLRLAKEVGRQTAHEIVYRACMRAIETGTSLKEEILEDPELAKGLDERELDSLLDPQSYVGLSRHLGMSQRLLNL